MSRRISKSPSRRYATMSEQQLAREQSSFAAKVERQIKVDRAIAMRAQGATLFAIASELGVTKEWLRTYAGLSER